MKFISKKVELCIHFNYAVTFSAKNSNHLRHRVGNKPAVIYSSGNKYYWLNGQPHRTDGPATENVKYDSEESKSYYIHG